MLFCLFPPVHYRTPASLGRHLLQMSGAPVFTSGALNFEVATQEIPFDHLDLVAKRVCVAGTHGIITIRKSCHRLPTSGYGTDSRLKHIFSLSIKAIYLIVLEL